MVAGSKMAAGTDADDDGGDEVDGYIIANTNVDNNNILDGSIFNEFCLHADAC